MRRGEVWWALLDERCPVVLLTGDGAPEARAIRVVAPATAEQTRGFRLLSAAAASEPSAAIVSPDIRAVGIEVTIGADAGLVPDGVIRVALPRDGHIFCTWLVTLSPEYLVERAGELSPAKLDELGQALGWPASNSRPNGPAPGDQPLAIPRRPRLGC